MKAKRLGRGLSGLIQTTEPTEPTAPDRGDRRAVARESATDMSASAIAVQEVRPNPYQPRQDLRREDLEDLIASIREHGILQPIVVRRGGAGYELIAGERRLRAAEALGLPTVPAIVRDASDEDMQTLALVENVQRVDLNAVEKARALAAMMRNFGLSQDEVAKRVGKARTTIANLVRLLDLPEDVIGRLEAGELSGAHGRALLQAQGRERRASLAASAVREGWSVRETERRARETRTGAGESRAAPRDPYVRDLEERLQRALATKARLRPRGSGGVIEIRYHDASELDRLLETFGA